MKQDTRIVTLGRKDARKLRVVNPPVVHASTVFSPTIAARRAAQARRARREPGFYYGRSGSPTARALEEALAGLEGGHDCLTFPSGLAAIAAALLAYLSAGDHLLMTDGVYQPVRKLCDRLLPRLGVETTYYPPRLGAGVADLIRPETRVVYVESPSSQTFEVQDIPAIAAAAHAGGAPAGGALVLADNTWASPYFCRPLDLGADVSIQAATKYVGGHSDLMLGAATATEAAWAPLRDAAGHLGQCAGPDDLYLAQRGLRSLAVRMRRHQETGLALAQWLERRSEIARVLHPGLPDDPGHALWRRDFSGASGLFSIVFEPCSEAAFAAFVDGLAHFGIGASWGGFESLALPAHPKRAAEPWRAEGPLLRLHAGLEDPADLIADLEAGFERMRAAG
ncbi:MAG: cystathionine beta-lyase [Alphaproteobacteria bacterium]